MNINKLLGLIASIVIPEPHEAISSIQMFIDKLNNKNIEAFITMAFPTTLIYPLYQLDIPENVITLKKVYDGESFIDQTFTEQRHMTNDRVGTVSECYVDRSKKIIFSYSLTSDNEIAWEDKETANWSEDETTDGKYNHQDDNTESWESTGLELIAGYRYQLKYTIGLPQGTGTGSITSVSIGGISYTDAEYLTTTEDSAGGEHTIEFTALTTDGLAITPSNDFNGYVEAISIIAQTSNIQCKATQTGTLTISTADDKYIPAAMHYALSNLFRLAKYKDEKESVNHYNEYKKEMATVEVNQVDITPSSYANGGF